MAAPSVTPVQPTSSSVERRRSARKPHVSEAFLSSPTGGNRIRVVSIDLSKHGVGLRLTLPIAAGTFQILELGLGPQRVVSEVRILSCETADDGSYHVHAAFC